MKGGPGLLHARTSATRSSSDQRSSGLPVPALRLLAAAAATTSAPASSGRWAAAPTRPSTPTTSRSSATASATSSATRWQSPSRGTFRTYVFDVKGAEELDYDLDWNALQILPGKVKASLNVRQYSDLAFQQQYQDDFNAGHEPHASAGRARSQQDLRPAVLSAPTPTPPSTYFGTDYTHVNGRLPAPRAAALPAQDRLGQVVVGLEARAEQLQYGRRGRTWTTGRASTSHPHISRPLRPELPRVHAVGALRYTRYGASYGTARRERRRVTAIAGPPVDRSLLRGAAWRCAGRPSRGVRHARASYSERFKHVIGPEVVWTYRVARRRLRLDPQVRRRRLLPRHEPGHLLAGAALLRQAPRRRAASRSPTSS